MKRIIFSLLVLFTVFTAFTPAPPSKPTAISVSVGYTSSCDGWIYVSFDAGDVQSYNRPYTLTINFTRGGTPYSSVFYLNHPAGYRYSGTLVFGGYYDCNSTILSSSGNWYYN